MRPPVATEQTHALNAVREAVQQFYADAPAVAFDPANPRVRLHEATYGAPEVWAALECLLTTRVTMGETVRAFERAFADAFSYRHGIMVNSGSSANLLAVSALTNPALADRLKPGDEVIVPALAWSTTVWPLIQHGLVPVVVDIDPQTLNIDPQQVERAIGPKTRGLMLVHVYGNPCDMAALGDLARRRRLMLIEDGCEAMGAKYDGQAVGTFGRIGTFSFYYSHHITTLEGGMCVTAETELAELCRILRAHGWVREVEQPQRYLAAHADIHPRFLFVNLGYNLRPTELQGAIGLEQLKRLDGFLRIREENASYWREAFAPHRRWLGMQEPTARGRSAWFGFPMWVTPDASFTAQQLTAFLSARGIETRPIIAGNIAAQPGLKLYPHRVAGGLPHANRIMRTGFTFGNHQQVNDEARAYVADAVRAFLQTQGAA